MKEKAFWLVCYTLFKRASSDNEACDSPSLSNYLSTPSMVDKNPLIWMLEVNGFIIDVRQAPREIQEEAFHKGLIPYIPNA